MNRSTNPRSIIFFLLYLLRKSKTKQETDYGQVATIYLKYPSSRVV